MIAIHLQRRSLKRHNAYVLPAPPSTSRAGVAHEHKYEPLSGKHDTQILDALAVLRDEGVIHCDLKPENVLLEPDSSGNIKVIDFGSACMQHETVYTYIQSRFYRSPEVRAMPLVASPSIAVEMCDQRKMRQHSVVQLSLNTGRAASWQLSVLEHILHLASDSQDHAPADMISHAWARQVLLGYPYNVAIDMWSLGCVAAELFLGLPLFPGASEHDLLTRVVEMMGPPPDSLLAAAKHTKKFFHRLDVNEMSPSGEPDALACFACAKVVQRAHDWLQALLPFCWTSTSQHGLLQNT